MPTIYDSVYNAKPQLSHQKTAIQLAHGITKEVDGYIAKSSLDLSLAATYTFHHGSKAARRVFQDVPDAQLQRALKSGASRIASSKMLRLPRHNTRTRTRTTTTTKTKQDHSHEMNGAIQYSDDHMNATTVAQLHDHGYNYVEMNSSVPIRKSGEKDEHFRTSNSNNSWRSCNPVPGLGEFRMIQESDQQESKQLAELERTMKYMGRINYMQFAPDLMPSPPKKGQKSKSKKFSVASRGTKMEAASQKRADAKAQRKQEKAIKIRNKKRAERRRAEAKASQQKAATTERLAKVERLQQKKVALKAKKQDKLERQKAILRLQALARGRRGRHHATHKRDRNHATQKIQAMHRGKRDRVHVKRLKQKRHEQVSASKKIQALRRGKQDRKRVEGMKQHKRENAASLKIQAIRRGRHGRQQAKEMKASRTIQAVHRGKQDRRKVKSLKKNKAEQEVATLKIQAAVRGKRGRSKAQRQKKMSQWSPEMREQIEEAAAIKIQSTWRMMIAVEDFEGEKDALLLVQSLMRGAIIRKKTALLQMQRLETKEDDPEDAPLESGDSEEEDDDNESAETFDLNESNATRLVAVEHFDAEEEGDVGFEEGVVLWGLELVEGWWTGQRNDKIGGMGQFPDDVVVAEIE